VLNRKLAEDRYVTSPAEFHLLPGVPQAIARLNRAGLRVIVVSNQRGIARGVCTASDVEAIHAAFLRELTEYGARVDALFFCPHDKNECTCRKPLPGLFYQARARFPEIVGKSSVMIGDSWSDIEFGRRLGLFTIFIENDRALQKPGIEAAREIANLRAASLAEAVEALLADPA
jgi:D-glycero-D-manno-heptose 1,7-bisphosphate phosphatase